MRRDLIASHHLRVPGGVLVCAAVYRPRRSAATLLHRVTRENLETYLAGGDQTDEFAANVPFHVEATYRQYLKCGILAHGFARAYCAGCGHDFLIAFSCKGRDICPSCATRRMVETAAHMVDYVLPRVPYRQWVLSVPKRVRWHLRTSSPQAGSRSDSIYECLPLRCPSCGQPMRIIAFILEPPVVERILGHIGEPVAPPVILPARSPPQAEMEFDQAAGRPEWPEMDQSADPAGETWN